MKILASAPNASASEFLAVIVLAVPEAEKTAPEIIVRVLPAPAEPTVYVEPNSKNIELNAMEMFGDWAADTFRFTPAVTVDVVYSPAESGLIPVVLATLLVGLML